MITIVSDLPGSERVSYVGTNNYLTGFVAGKILLRVADFAPDKRLVIVSTAPGEDRQISVAESLKVFGLGRRFVPRGRKSFPSGSNSNLRF